jgi:cytochrome c2
MRRINICFFAGLLLLGGTAFFSNEVTGAEKREGYLLLGDVKEGWKVFVTKKCSACHSIWGEGGKGGPDLGTLPESHVSQAQLAALIWNHLPEMWGRMMAKKIPLEKIDKKGMADLFAFLYFIRYMDEPGDPRKGKVLMEMKNCSKCHAVGEETKGDFTHWGTYANSILWAEMMWNHAPQMEQQMRKRGIPWVEFKGNEMVDLIAYISWRSCIRGEIVYEEGMCPMSRIRERAGFGKEEGIPKNLSPISRNDVESLLRDAEGDGGERHGTPPPLLSGNDRSRCLPFFHPVL